MSMYVFIFLSGSDCLERCTFVLNRVQTACHKEILNPVIIHTHLEILAYA